MSEALETIAYTTHPPACSKLHTESQYFANPLTVPFCMEATWGGALRPTPDSESAT